jgi:hypothetical protein
MIWSANKLNYIEKATFLNGITLSITFQREDSLKLYKFVCIANYLFIIQPSNIQICMFNFIANKIA